MDNKVIKRVIGVDIDIKETLVAVVDQRGVVIAREAFPTTDYPQIGSFVETLSQKIVMLAEGNGGYETIRSVGVSAHSANYQTGCIENAGNLPWKGVIPLSAMLRDRIGLAVAVANNVHASGLGEFVYGSAHGMTNFIVMSLGKEGLGCSIFSNGQSYLGANGFAGEIGHCCMVENGRQCTCGNYGCLEEYVSERGIVQTAREVLASSTEPCLLRELSELSSSAIGLCMDQGDALATETYRRTGEMLGIGLANLATVINPEAIVLTGGLTAVCKWMIPSAQEAFEEHVFHNIRNRVKLVISTLDEHERNVLGASALAWTEKEYSLFKE